MADLFTPVTAAVYDPIIKIDERATYPIIKGGNETTLRQFTTNSASNSSVQFSVPPPNPGTFVSRRFKLKQPVSITFNLQLQGYAGPALNNIQGLTSGRSAFRQYPLASIMKTLNVAINGSTISLPVNDVIKPLLLFHNNNRNLEAREMSTSPGMRDQTQDYTQLSNGPAVKNPLGTFGDSTFREGGGRGGFPYTSFTNLGTLSATGALQVSLEAELVEELFLSPLVFGGGDDQGFIGVQAIDINIAWDPNLAKIWSHDPQSEILAGGLFYPFSIESMVVDLAAANGLPSMLFTYVTPPRNMRIPRSLQYYYNDVDRYETVIGTANFNGAYQTMISNNLQLNSIPRFLYIFVKRNTQGQATAHQATSSCDAYASLQNLRINWNNKNTLLSNATREQLYEMSRKNGVDLSWGEWSAEDSFMTYNNTNHPTSAVDNINCVYGLGSVICIEFGTDIGLDDGEAPGLIGTYNLQVQVDWQWKSRSYTSTGAIAQAQISLFLVTVTPGIFTIYDNAASQRIGVLSKDQISRSGAKVGLDYKDTQENLMSGGMKFRKAVKMARRKGMKRHHSKKPVLDAMAQGVLAGMGARKKSSAMEGLIGGRRRRRRRKPLMAAGRRRKPLVAGGRRRKAVGGRKRKVGRPKKKR